MLNLKLAVAPHLRPIVTIFARLSLPMGLFTRVLVQDVLGGLLAIVIGVLIPVRIAIAGAFPCPEQIRFGLTEHGYMYDMAMDVGIDRDLAEELARRSGCRFVFVPRPRARLWHEMENGSLHMSGSVIPTEERARYAWFAVYAAQKNYVLVRNEVTANSMREFLIDRQLRWGSVRGYRHGEHADHFMSVLRAQARVVDEPEIRSLFRSFARGKVDGIFGQPVVFAKYIKEIPPAEPIRIVDWFHEEAPVLGALALSKQHFSAAEAARWQALIELMRDDGTLRSIYLRYVSADVAQEMLNFPKK